MKIFVNPEEDNYDDININKGEHDLDEGANNYINI